MSEIKALEELREKLERDTSKAKLYPTAPIKHAFAEGATIEGHRALADAIEAEIAERFMELPVDADGVPIRVGDELECHTNGYDGTFTVFAIGNNVAVGNHDIEWIRRNPSKWFHIASFCTHVKPRTLESILCDALADVSRMNDGNVRTFKPDAPYVAELAAEIRECLGVSE